MKRQVKCGLTWLALIFIMAAPAHASSKGEWDNLVAKAQKEGKVVIYASPQGDTSAELTKEFKKKFGIELEFSMARGGQLEKLLTERRAGLYLADVGIGGAEPFFSVVEPSKLAVPLEPLIVLDEIRDPTKWRFGKLPFLEEKKAVIALAASVMSGIAINTTMVKENEITSYEDLLEPKWRGNIALNDPTIMGMSNDWFSFMMLQSGFGREKAAKFMRQLALQKPIISRDERLQVEWLAKGKYPVGLALKPTAVTSFINMGAPIKFVAPLKEGLQVTSGASNLYAFDKAPHPNAAKLFINWILTKEAGDIFARKSGYPSTRKDATTEGFDAYSLPGPNDDLGTRDVFVAKKQMFQVATDIFRDLVK